MSPLLLSFSKRKLCHLDSNPGAYLASLPQSFGNLVTLYLNKLLILDISCQQYSTRCSWICWHYIFQHDFFKSTSCHGMYSNIIISRAEYYYTFYSTICLWYFIFLLMHIELFQNFTIINTVMINIILQTSAITCFQLWGTSPLLESLGKKFIG